MEYNKTINLPTTQFQMKADLPKKEPQIQKRWEEMKLYEVIQEKNKSAPRYILHDGPPYANGNIHMGHALNKILKDIIVKFKLMEGFNVPFVPGWDCHGLPIEYQLLKSIGLRKEEIDRVEFRRKARAYAQGFARIQKEEFKRLGIFGEWENPYLTMSFDYEAKIIEIFKRLVVQGYIYRGKKPVYWCANCETALAEAEVEYSNHTSHSVYVKFPVKMLGRDKGAEFELPAKRRLKSATPKRRLKSATPTSVLIWTTTPWTLPANVALAFHPEYEYAWVKLSPSDPSLKEEIIIVAKQLVSNLMEKFGIENYNILKVSQGRDLEGGVFSHPFMARDSVGICADFVTLEEGTGIVHIAPGHGQEDYQIGLKYGLPVLAPVDDKGKFTEEVPQFSGVDVFSSNSLIIERLKNSSHLLHSEEIVHTYPHCWRCKKPIIFRATEQWFLDVDKHQLREKMLEVIKKVKWIPKIGENRISSMVEGRPDWCLSRQRYWGVPLPIFYCKNCGEPLMSEESMGAVQDLVLREGSDAWYIKKEEEILPKGTECPKCKKRKFIKEKDILDVWFDSGVSHEAVLRERENLSWPADLYLEGSDQHRGWFQTSLIPAVALEKAAPFKSVLTHGFVVDGEGRKMSKSIGNVIAPQEIIEKYGAEILRLWVASEDYREDVRISSEILGHLVEGYRRIRNTFRFLLGNLNDFDLSKKVKYEEMSEIDQWMLHCLQELISQVTEDYESFGFHRVYRAIHNFCSIELSSFYLDVLKDRLYTFGRDSLSRRSAQTVLYEIAVSLIKLTAPILAHTAEEVWRMMPGIKEPSVFLTNLPRVEKKYWNEQLAEKWEKILLLRKSVVKALEIARKEKIIGSSLEAEVDLYAQEKELVTVLHNYERDWKGIFIVSEVKVFEELPSGSSGAGNDKSEVMMKSEEMPELYMGVRRAPGRKCVRCWNWRPTVGEDREHPQLCRRCVEVVKNL
jgi:isoleucyl-tRNA synthetase